MGNKKYTRKAESRDYRAPGPTNRVRTGTTVPSTAGRVPHKICQQCSDLPHARPETEECACGLPRGELKPNAARPLIGSSGGLL